MIRSNPKFRNATYTFLSKIRQGVEALCGSEFGPLQVFLLAELLGPAAVSARWVTATHLGTDIELHLGTGIHEDEWRYRLEAELRQGGDWEALARRVATLCQPAPEVRAAAAEKPAPAAGTAVTQMLREHLQLRHGDPATLAAEHRQEIESRPLAADLAGCVSAVKALQIKQAAFADERSARLDLQRKFAVQRVVAQLPKLVDLILSETSALKRPSFAWADFIARLHKRHPQKHRLSETDVCEQLELLLQIAPSWVRSETHGPTRFVLFDKAVARKQVVDLVAAFERELAQSDTAAPTPSTQRSARLIDSAIGQLENLQQTLLQI